MTNYDYGWRKVFLIKILLLLPFYYWEILQILKVTHYLSHTTAALARQSARVGVLVLTIDLRPWSFYPSSNFPLFFSLSAHLLPTPTLALLRFGLGAVGFSSFKLFRKENLSSTQSFTAIVLVKFVIYLFFLKCSSNYLLNFISLYMSSF